MNVSHTYTQIKTYNPSIKVFKGTEYVPLQRIDLDPIVITPIDIPGFEEHFDLTASSRWHRTNSNGTVTFNDGTVYLCITSTDRIPCIERNEHIFVANNRVYMEARWKIAGSGSVYHKAVQLHVEDVNNANQICMPYGQDTYMDGLLGLELAVQGWVPYPSPHTRTGSVVTNTYVVCKSWYDGSIGLRQVQFNDGPIVSQTNDSWKRELNECKVYIDVFGWWTTHDATIDYIKITTW